MFPLLPAPGTSSLDERCLSRLFRSLPWRSRSSWPRIHGVRDFPGPRAPSFQRLTAPALVPESGCCGKHLRLSGKRDWCTISGFAADVRATRCVKTTEGGARLMYSPYGPGSTSQGRPFPSKYDSDVRSSAHQRQFRRPHSANSRHPSDDTPVAEFRPIPASCPTPSPHHEPSLSSLFSALPRSLLVWLVGIYGVSLLRRPRTPRKSACACSRCATA